MVDVKRRQRACALSLAALTVAAICALPQSAGADAIADKQAQANAIAAKIDELNHVDRAQRRGGQRRPRSNSTA